MALPICALLIGACRTEGGSRPPGGRRGHKDIDPSSLEGPARDAWAKPDDVVAALPIERDDFVIADIGSGSGYFTRRIAKRVPNGTVFAIDIDVKLKHYIEAHLEEWGTPNIKTRLAVNEHPLLAQGTFDLVFMSNTYAYIDDKVGYFKEIARALRPGGYAVVIDFRPGVACTPDMSCPDEQMRSAEQEVVDTLSKAGLERVDSLSLLSHQYFLVFRLAD